MKPFRHFLILTLICLPALVGCNKESIDLSLLHEEVEALHQRCEKMERAAGELRKELRIVREKQDELNTALNKGRSVRGEVETQAKEMLAAFADYRLTYRDAIRKRAKGMTFPFLEMEGRRFVSVVVRELSDSEMTFQHRDGISRVDSEKLPTEVKDLFVIDGSQAVLVASEAQSLKLAPIPSFLSLDLSEPAPAPLLVAPELPVAAPAAACPPCIAAPRPTGNIPSNYRPIGSSFQGSFYRNKTSVGFQGTR